MFKYYVVRFLGRFKKNHPAAKFVLLKKPDLKIARPLSFTALFYSHAC